MHILAAANHGRRVDDEDIVQSVLAAQDLAPQRARVGGRSTQAPQNNGFTRRAIEPFRVEGSIVVLCVSP
jgi:hypothetical protein